MEYTNLKVGDQVKVNTSRKHAFTKYSSLIGGNITVELKKVVSGTVYQTHEEVDIPFLKARPGVNMFYTIKVPYYENENCTMYTHILVEPRDVIEII